MISRRRFLSITAAATGVAISPRVHAASTTSNWRGRAFGADISIGLSGSDGQREAALEAALDTIRRLESYFSIYNPASLLSRLNRDGRLKMPPEFARLMRQAGRVHEITNGLFDPTVQPLFAAHLENGGALSLEERKRLAGLVGWDRIDFRNADMKFSTVGMALTLNGIAQGFATDRVSEVLEAYGFMSTRINIGEYRVNNSAMELQIADESGSPITTLQIENGAVATSEINGYTFSNGSSHILRPDGYEQLGLWRSASVHADTATMADGVSTALLLSVDDSLARDLVGRGVVRSVVLHSSSGLIIRI